MFKQQYDYQQQKQLVGLFNRIRRNCIRAKKQIGDLGYDADIDQPFFELGVDTVIQQNIEVHSQQSDNNNSNSSNDDGDNVVCYYQIDSFQCTGNKYNRMLNNIDEQGYIHSDSSLFSNCFDNQPEQHTNRSTNNHGIVYDEQSELESLSDGFWGKKSMFCDLCLSDNHVYQFCDQQYCKKCQQIGHDFKQCPIKIKIDRKKLKTNKQNRLTVFPKSKLENPELKSIRCLFCNKYGHINCKQLQQDDIYI